MPLRHRLGFPLALLMISTTVLAGTSGKSAAGTLLQNPADGAARAHRSRGRRSASGRALAHALARHARWGRHMRHRRSAVLRSAAAVGQSAVYHPSGEPQIGKAAWYGLEGRLTASGERMNDARATAAHRSLPLLSYARVTNLDNGRSVVVQINDRGPAVHRFIIDLSPRAAEEIGMMHTGVAAVSVQPLATRVARAGQPIERLAAAR